MATITKRRSIIHEITYRGNTEHESEKCMASEKETNKREETERDI